MYFAVAKSKPQGKNEQGNYTKAFFDKYFLLPVF